MALIRFKQIEKSLPGNLSITGSLTVAGNVTFIQTSSIPALIISGSEVIVKSDTIPSTYSASLSIQNLGTFADTGSNGIVDLGDNSF
jgi:hypothetical protein